MIANIQSIISRKGSNLIIRFKAIMFNPWLPLILAALLWVGSFSDINLGAMQDWGLISIFPISILIAYLLTLLGFAGLFLRTQVSEAIFMSYALLLILLVHGTPQLLYGTLRYSWAWKHVGLVDYIIRHGAVDPNIGILGIYHNWPGFFALNALYTQLAGFSGAQVYAGWGPAFFEILFAWGWLALFRLFTPDRRLQWLGVWFFLLTNWVGQDYFSPQAMSYFMLIGVLVLIFRYFSSVPTLNLDAWKNRYFFKGPIMNIFQSLIEWLAKMEFTKISREVELVKYHRWALGCLVLLCYAAIVSSHQLTPFMGVLFGLVLAFGSYTRWKTLPIWMSAFIILWFLFPAKLYTSGVIESIVNSYGNLFHNIDSGFINVATVSPGQALVAWMGRGLSAAIGVLAGIGVCLRVRHRYLDLHIILLAAAPLAIIFLNTYGGEALFRMYFFSLPFLSFLAARVIFPRDNSERNWRQVVGIGGLSTVLLVGLLFAYYGKEQQYYFTKGEVEAAEFIFNNAEPNSLLVEGARNYPSQFLNYEYFTYVPIDREPSESQERLLHNPVRVLDAWLSNPDYVASYLIITRSQKSYTDSVGVLPLGTLDRIQEALETSDNFEIALSNQDAIIFTKRIGK